MRLNPLFVVALVPVSLHASIVPGGGISDPHPAQGNLFGQHVIPLANGNVVITAPGDDAGGQDAGAVYLFEGSTGTLVSTLTGSTPGDGIGSGGVFALPGGNFVVCSPEFDDGVIVQAGAVTWVNGSTGLSGTVNASNSLVGATADDRVGREAVLSTFEIRPAVTVLASGNYVVATPGWDNGAFMDAGAVTWCSGTAATTGAVSASNSLVGSTAWDRIGAPGDHGKAGVFALPGGNYVVVSPDWSNGSARWAGAATWGSGSSGVKGPISASNSLVGGTQNSLIGSGGVTILANGNYVVSSPYCYKGTTANVGAATWGSGGTGVKGVVSTTNSLMGSRVNDHVSNNGITVLTNGNYVVNSPEWDSGTKGNAGAATWGNGASGVKGAVSGTNSLVGSSAGDYVGYTSTALTNGHYVVGSPYRKGGFGAATWGNGATGVKGAITATNSLLGTAGVGAGGRIVALTNGHYVVVSSYNQPSGYNLGAVTWCNGTAATTGTVSAANSLTGVSENDYVGSNILPLSNGNYVVGSEFFDHGGIQGAEDAGAATWCSGTAVTSDVVSAANSLVGSSWRDEVGKRGYLYALAGGNYVVASPGWNLSQSVQNAGAVTWGNGNGGTTGPISASNSLIGGRSSDEVGMKLIVLENGNYVTFTPDWDLNGGDRYGAITWGSAASGVSGPITRLNSLIGTTWYEGLGHLAPVPLANGNYVVLQTRGNLKPVSATLGDGADGTRGEVHENNTGYALDSDTTTFYTTPPQVISDDARGLFYASVPDAGQVLVASQTTGFPTTTSTVERADGVPLVPGQPIDFGKLMRDQEKTIGLVLKNTGTYPLAITKAALHQSGPFSLLGGFPTLLQPGESATLQVNYSYTPFIGLHSVNLELFSNTTGEATRVIPLKGETVTEAEGAYDSFLTAAGLSGAAADPEAEPHRDGVANILKFAFNMDGSGPANYTLQPGGSSGLPRVEIVEQFGNTYLQVQYISHYSNVGLNLKYTPKWSTSLDPGSFITMTGPVSNQSLPDHPGWKLVTAREYIDLTVHKKAFGIVEVTPAWD
jgi:hypothetical protein